MLLPPSLNDRESERDLRCRAGMQAAPHPSTALPPHLLATACCAPRSSNRNPSPTLTIQPTARSLLIVFASTNIAIFFSNRGNGGHLRRRPGWCLVGGQPAVHEVPEGGSALCNNTPTPLAHLFHYPLLLLPAPTSVHCHPPTPPAPSLTLWSSLHQFHLASRRSSFSPFAFSCAFTFTRR